MRVPGDGSSTAWEGNGYGILAGRDARTMDVLYRVNPSGAAALIARQRKDLIGN